MCGCFMRQWGNKNANSENKYRTTGEWLRRACEFRLLDISVRIVGTVMRGRLAAWFEIVFSVRNRIAVDNVEFQIFKNPQTLQK